jgi:predicted DNA-binding protein (MmcQ/YjbR family)
MATTAHDRAPKEVRAHCLALPETSEVEARGHPTSRAGKKMFAAFGEAFGVLATGLKVGHERQEVLLEDGRFSPTPYAARQGWVSLRIGGTTDWEEVGRLIQEAYRQVVPKRMLKVLDGVE